MSFNVIASKTFVNQVSSLDKKSRSLIHKKISLIKENPFRFKKINSKHFSKVFRVRFSISRKETRLIYVIIEPDIVLVCLLDRKDDYKTLEAELKKVN